VDIEYVGKNSSEPVVAFSVKPQEYLPSGAASNVTYQQARPSFDLSMVTLPLHFEKQRAE